MADPYIPAGAPSLIDALGRDVMHEEDLQKTVIWLRDEFAREGIPFGIIGAFAMRMNGFTRHTEDLDIVTTRDGLDLIHERLVGRGLAARAAGRRKALRNTIFRVNLDFVVAGESAGSSESPIRFPDPSGPEFDNRRDGVRYATLPVLLTLKIAAGEWGHRMRDWSDAIRLIQLHQLDDSYAELLPEPVRDKFRWLVQRGREEIDISDE